MIDAKTQAQQMDFNKTHILTVCRDWRENGLQYWRLLHGHERESGYAIGEYRTRGAALGDALEIARRTRRDTPYGAPLYCILAYEHGYRQFRWVSVPTYDRTGEIRHV